MGDQKRRARARPSVQAQPDVDLCAAFSAAVRESVSRRQFLGGIAAVAALGLPQTRARSDAPLAAALPVVTEFRPSMKGTGVLRVASGGGPFTAALKKAIFEPFEALSGIKVISTDGFSTAQIKSQVDAKAVQWDVVGLEYSSIADLGRQGEYFEKLDYALIAPDGIAREDMHERSIGYMQVATIIDYRTDAFGGRVPQGYRDFWDLARFPGPRNWMSGALGICPFLEGALLADGVPRDHLYPLDVPRALKSLTKIRDSIVKFWDSGAQSAQLMASDETVLGVAWNGRISPLTTKGLPVRIQWNDGMLLGEDWAVLKGSANVRNAMKYIAFASLPQVQARLSLLFDYGFTNSHAAEFIPHDRLEVLPGAHASQGFRFDSEWWSVNKASVVDAVTRWSLARS
jgi:putative spermidine/putrescine transport system substrate-binding protein